MSSTTFGSFLATCQGCHQRAGDCHAFTLNGKVIEIHLVLSLSRDLHMFLEYLPINLMINEANLQALLAKQLEATTTGTWQEGILDLLPGFLDGGLSK